MLPRSVWVVLALSPARGAALVARRAPARGGGLGLRGGGLGGGALPQAWRWTPAWLALLGSVWQSWQWQPGYAVDVAPVWGARLVGWGAQAWLLGGALRAVVEAESIFLREEQQAMERFKQGWFVGGMAALGVAGVTLAVLLWEVDRGLLVVYALVAVLLGAGVGALGRWPRMQQVFIGAPMLLGILQILYGVTFEQVPLYAPLHVYFLALLAWYWAGVGLYQYTQHRRRGETPA